MSIVTRKLYHLSGLSTDTKPIPEDIATGSTFYETDTGVNFVFNKSTNQWIPSKEKVEPQVETPCLGILSIELTSRAGLVDTYTIRYTNGASTTFNVTNGGYVTPNIDIKTPLIDNKIYTLDINTEKYNLYATADFRVTEVTDNSIKSEVIDHTKFWPRTDEGKFLLQIAADTTLVFNYVGIVNDLETWQAVEINSENLFTRYVGHFEYVDDHNRENSDFYFVAEKQTISFIDLKESVDSLDERATSLENRTSTLEAGLTAEEQRATSVEAALEALINEHIEDYTEVVERISTEETRSIVKDAELDSKIEQEIKDRQRDVGSRAKTEDYNQEIIANKVDVRSFELFGDQYASRGLKVATIKANANLENRTLEIYQEVVEDQQIPVEKIKVNALDTELAGDLTIDNIDDDLDRLFPIDEEEQGE